MKKSISFLFGCFLLMQIAAQTFTYTYTYDASGNRIKRVCAQVKSLEGESIYDIEARSLKDSYTPAETFSGELGSSVITLYPNPTRGELVLRIHPLAAGSTGKITVIGLDGKQHLVITELYEYNDVDFTGLSRGVYILRLELNGKETTYEIIKE
jgi:YD repeat-containing protein